MCAKRQPLPGISLLGTALAPNAQFHGELVAFARLATL